jgi:alanine racemase
MDPKGITIKEIARIIKGRFLAYNTNDEIFRLSTDSRKESEPQTTLFFAIRGERHDGHAYFQEMYEKGVRSFVVSNISFHIIVHDDVNIIYVKDTIRALQRLAAHRRKQFQIPVIGITGSNGKTIVKEWLSVLLEPEHKLVRSPKSYNSQIGVPLSVWNLNSSHDLAVFEAGISQPGEMKNLVKVIQPTLGIFTNIGRAHDENFSGKAEKVREKIKLFEHVETLIYCSDYQEIAREVGLLYIRRPKQVFSWSMKNGEANLKVVKLETGASSTQIKVEYLHYFYFFKLPFTDRANIENAIHCIATMLVLNYTPDTINDRISRLNPVSMRMELLDGVNNSTLISDVYNSDLGSLEIALDFLNQQRRHIHKTVILSDIYQTGITDEVLYKQIAKLLSRYSIEKFVGIGPVLMKYQDFFHQNASFFQSTEDFLLEENLAFRNETILIKGSRVFGMERITQVLQQKIHETVLEINLSKMIHNLNYYRSKLNEGVKMMVMVKAFSYGSGIYEVANLLEYQRVDYLTVAYPDEGVALRKAGIQMPIMVMNPEISAYRVLLKYKMEPEIYSFRTLRAFILAAEQFPEFAPKYFIHIKIDTGMHRLGFDEHELDQVVDAVKEHPLVRIQSVFSHLASAPLETEEARVFTLNQIKQFEKASKKVQDRLGYRVIRHILNTPGLERYGDYQMDMVRLGLGLYGIGQTGEAQAQLLQVGRLRTIISQIKEIPIGDTVGYDQRFKAQRKTRVATLPIGYADGLMRTLGNQRGKVLIHGKKAPFIGNICMDMAMVDVTDIPCEEGDDAIIFGDDLSVSEFAEDMQTIPYEALTHISRRVKRVYFQD